jgi:hypothetical protein
VAVYAVGPNGSRYPVSALHALIALGKSKVELCSPDDPEGFFCF